MILPDPVGETVVPTSEPSASATVPKHTFTITPETATTSVPEQTDVVKQQPEQPHHPSPKQTTISTQLKLNLKTNILHKRLFQNLLLRQFFLNLYKLQSLNKLWQ